MSSKKHQQSNEVKKQPNESKKQINEFKKVKSTSTSTIEKLSRGVSTRRTLNAIAQVVAKAQDGKVALNFKNLKTLEQTLNDNKVSFNANVKQIAPEDYKTIWTFVELMKKDDFILDLPLNTALDQITTSQTQIVASVNGHCKQFQDKLNQIVDKSLVKIFQDRLTELEGPFHILSSIETLNGQERETKEKDVKDAQREFKSANTDTSFLTSQVQTLLKTWEIPKKYHDQSKAYIRLDQTISDLLFEFFDELKYRKKRFWGDMMRQFERFDQDANKAFHKHTTNILKLAKSFFFQMKALNEYHDKQLKIFNTRLASAANGDMKITPINKKDDDDVKLTSLPTPIGLDVKASSAVLDTDSRDVVEESYCNNKIMYQSQFQHDFLYATQQFKHDIQTLVTTMKKHCKFIMQDEWKKLEKVIVTFETEWKDLQEQRTVYYEDFMQRNARENLVTQELQTNMIRIHDNITRLFYV